MNRTQLTLALERMDRLYPNVTHPDYRDEAIRLGAAFPPLARTARQLADLLRAHRTLPHEELLADLGDRIRELHDTLREHGHRLLNAAHWPYD